MKPFSDRPLQAWIKVLQEGTSSEERYHALLAVNAIATRPEAVHWSHHSLRDADSSVRALAAKQLGEWKRREQAGTPATDAADTWNTIGGDLSSSLADEDPDVRFEAARALGSVSPQLTAAREMLLEMLDDAETLPLMKAVVISALSQRQDLDFQSMIPRLKNLLAESQVEVRENASAMVAASKQAASALLSELLVALEDEEPIVRENAAMALGLSGVNEPQLLSALSQAEQDEDVGVAGAARDARLRLSNR